MTTESRFVVPSEALQHMLNEHKRWLETGHDGAQLTTERCGDYFEGLMLDGVDFRNADLKMVDFEGCSLIGANFTGCCLDSSRVLDCTLDRADFTGADLRRATFDRNSGIEAAVFTNAKLLLADIPGVTPPRRPEDLFFLMLSAPRLP